MATGAGRGVPRLRGEASDMTDVSDDSDDEGEDHDDGRPMRDCWCCLRHWVAVDGEDESPVANLGVVP